VQITLNGAGRARAGIGLTNVGLTPIKARQAEASGWQDIDEANIKQAAQLAASESQPMDDSRIG
jgi:carbon-monoxide dehydrogenase medium subunit